MVLIVANLTLTRASMPQQYQEMGIRFERHEIARFKGGVRDEILLRPAAKLLAVEEDIGPEPRYHLIMSGLQLKFGENKVAQGSGQLVITGKRLLGMIDEGTVSGGVPLSVDASGKVFCFSILHEDVEAPIIKRQRLQPSIYEFRAKDAQTTSFAFTVYSALACVNGNRFQYWHDRDMDHALSIRGRQELLVTG